MRRRAHSRGRHRGGERQPGGLRRNAASGQVLQLVATRGQVRSGTGTTVSETQSVLTTHE